MTTVAVQASIDMTYQYFLAILTTAIFVQILHAVENIRSVHTASNYAKVSSTDSVRKRMVLMHKSPIQTISN